MADITMCTTKDCPFEQTCYRKTAIPTIGRQVYQAFPLSRTLTGLPYCEFYDNKEGLPPQVVSLQVIQTSEDFDEEVENLRLEDEAITWWYENFWGANPAEDRQILTEKYFNTKYELLTIEQLVYIYMKEKTRNNERTNSTL